MDKTGYILTDWIFFFNSKNKEDLKNVLTVEQNKELTGEFITWKLITVFLPVVPFAIVFFLNLCTNVNCPDLFFSFLNNGSLPIISFGIITAGMPYLLEQLSQIPEYHVIRRRVMAVSLFFLFLTASLYIFQTLYILNAKINLLTNSVSLLLSIYVFFFSASIGYKMFILQTKNIQPFDKEISDKVDQLKDSLMDMD